MTVDRNPISGFCAPEFQAVEREFRRNFEERGELGGSVAIVVEGRPVVDLWGGVADEASGAEWGEDTLAVVFSCTKGLAALCLHMLSDRGLLDLEAPVARYWPEFAANGKSGITVAMVMSHQAGLPVWQEPLSVGAMLDWDLVTRRLAQEAPLWEPGTCHGYHPTSLGFLEGEILRRITGRSIGQFLREDVTGPLEADAWIGLPESEEHRVAPLSLAASDPNSPFVRKLRAEPAWFGWKLINNSGGDGGRASVNSRARHAAEIPASGGIANARSLARIYAPLSLDGSIDGVRLVSEAALPSMRTARSASDCDLVLRLPTAFTLGFSKSWGARGLGPGNHVILGEQAFGAPGMGGSLGFADGGARMAFGYVMNRHGAGVGLNDRGQGLVDAAYASLGFRLSPSGSWVR